MKKIVFLSGLLCATTVFFAVAAQNTIPNTSPPQLMPPSTQDLSNAESAKFEPTAASNIKILADQMECDQNNNKCVAIGHAIAQKLNDPDNRTISADKLVAFFSKKELNAPSRLIKIEAEGNVVVTTKETVIRAPRGHYDVDQEYAEMFEDVRVTNTEKNHVTGHYGEVCMKTGLYKIKSEGQQVQALIFSADKK